LRPPEAVGSERDRTLSKPRQHRSSVARAAVSARLPLFAPSGSRADVAAQGVIHQHDPARTRGSFAELTAVGAHDRFDRGAEFWAAIATATIRNPGLSSRASTADERFRPEAAVQLRRLATRRLTIAFDESDRLDRGPLAMPMATFRSSGSG
jgi:hypothetical protein